MLHNFLSRPLSFLGWTTAIVFLLDFHQAQTAAQLIFNEPKIAHVTPHSLSLCTGYRLQLTSSSRQWCLHIKQPQAQHPPTSTHWSQSTSPPEVWDLLVSDASRLKITFQNILVHRSWLVEWSSHPHPGCWIPVNL